MSHFPERGHGCLVAKPSGFLRLYFQYAPGEGSDAQRVAGEIGGRSRFGNWNCGFVEVSSGRGLILLRTKTVGWVVSPVPNAGPGAPVFLFGLE